VIPNNVTTIGDNAFSACHSLTNVVIPHSVTSIGINAFYGCISLTNIEIPDSVTSIGNDAFSYSGLTSVTIPSNVSNIGYEAFYSCSSLTAITVEAGNSAYRSDKGVLYAQNGTTLIRYPPGKLESSYAIPQNVTSIGAGAFEACPVLTSVTIPSSVTSIGNSAFEGCSGLANIYFQRYAPTAGASVFLFDSNATIYYLPGTKGWGTTFAGLPTAVWTPQVLTGAASLGVRTNGFGFTINWASGLTVVVEASTNLANPSWSPLATNTLTTGSAYFSDRQWTNYHGRFYRLRWP
jgi:BspA type Leucine rich repeat region (6 copies)